MLPTAARIPAGCRVLFQSTHSLRSATLVCGDDEDLAPVSIHALLAECDFPWFPGCRGLNGFNPRTPCGVRRCKGAACRTDSVFQSTHSLRSATPWAVAPALEDLVSIHALLAECDCFHRPGCGLGTCFNPRTPCGVRLPNGRSSSGRYGFNPRTPCGVRHGV